MKKNIYVKITCIFFSSESVSLLNNNFKCIAYCFWKLELFKCKIALQNLITEILQFPLNHGVSFKLNFHLMFLVATNLCVCSVSDRYLMKLVMALHDQQYIWSSCSWKFLHMRLLHLRDMVVNIFSVKGSNKIYTALTKWSKPNQIMAKWTTL